MPEISYELIAPLVEQQDLSGYGLSVVFRCPVSHQQVNSSAQIAESNSTGSTVKKSLWRNLRWSLSSVMRGVFGYSVAGRIGSDLARGAVSGAVNRERQPSEEEIKGATLEAFSKVQSQFAWDSTNERFVSASVFRELQTDFAVAVSTTPIVKQWDRNILARMLAEVAIADGNVGDEERTFFYSFSGEGMPSIDELIAKPPLSSADLGETSAEVRELMLLLATALACSDEQFDNAEICKLANFSAGLGIDPARQNQLEAMAKDYIVDQLLERAYADGVLHPEEHAQVKGLAAKLEVPEANLERLDARCRKRKGIL